MYRGGGGGGGGEALDCSPYYSYVTYRISLLLALSSCDVWDDAEDWIESSDDSELLRRRRDLRPGIWDPETGS
jgi:hypothetical protein